MERVCLRYTCNAAGSISNNLVAGTGVQVTRATAFPSVCTWSTETRGNDGWWTYSQLFAVLAGQAASKPWGYDRCELMH